MASVHAISNTSLPLSTMQVPVSRSKPLVDNRTANPQKWTYLLANHIRFTDKQAYSIRMPKPEQSTLHLWVEKIVASGQCAHLFIEQLSVDEVSFKRIKQLCTEHNVTLVNLLRQEDIQNNVIQGPW